MNCSVKTATLIACLSIITGCSGDVLSPEISSAVLSQRAAAGFSEGSFVVGLRDARSSESVAAEVAALGGTVTYVHKGTGLMLVDGLTGKAAATLATRPGVQEIREDAAFHLDAPVVAKRDQLVPDAPMSQTNPAGAVLFGFQWDMRLIGADAAWAAGKLGSSDVTVAIIDSGLDYDNRDLVGLVDLSRSRSFVPGDDSITAAYFPTRNVVDDYNGHGTNVATQVSSKAFAFAGVTSRTTLMAVKVLGWNGAGNVGRTLAGILWATDHGANIANLSLGGGFEKAGAQGLGGFIQRVVNYANGKGMLLVVAAGNNASDMDHDGNAFNSYCNAVRVICVSSVGPVTALLNQDEPSFFTNFGRSAITVAAPGGNGDPSPGAVPSARPWGNDTFSWIWSFCARRSIADRTATGVPILAGCLSGSVVLAAIGTSQAAPHVAGLAALLMAEGVNANGVRQAIVSSADDLGQPGIDPFYGSGRINVRKALGL